MELGRICKVCKVSPTLGKCVDLMVAELCFLLNMSYTSWC